MMIESTRFQIGFLNLRTFMGIVCHWNFWGFRLALASPKKVCWEDSRRPDDWTLVPCGHLSSIASINYSPMLMDMLGFQNMESIQKFACLGKGVVNRYISWTLTIIWSMDGVLALLSMDQLWYLQETELQHWSYWIWKIKPQNSDWNYIWHPANGSNGLPHSSGFHMTREAGCHWTSVACWLDF